MRHCEVEAVLLLTAPLTTDVPSMAHLLPSATLLMHLGLQVWGVAEGAPVPLKELASWLRADSNMCVSFPACCCAQVQRACIGRLDAPCGLIALLPHA